MNRRHFLANIGLATLPLSFVNEIYLSPHRLSKISKRVPNLDLREIDSDFLGFDVERNNNLQHWMIRQCTNVYVNGKLWENVFSVDVINGSVHQVIENSGKDIYLRTTNGYLIEISNYFETGTKEWYSKEKVGILNADVKIRFKDDAAKYSYMWYYNTCKPLNLLITPNQFVEKTNPFTSPKLDKSLIYKAE